MERVSINQLLQTIYPLPEALLQKMLGAVEELDLPKNYFLLRAGKPCQKVWLMTKGACRYFVVDGEGKDRNVAFSFDQDVVTDAVAFLTGAPATQSIQLLEDSIAYQLSHGFVQEMIQKEHAFAIWYIRLLEQYHTFPSEERMYQLQMLSAKERYEDLLRQHPGITNRINLGHIASYLNITPETLSRIRAAY